MDEAQDADAVAVDCETLSRDGGWFATQLKPNGLALAQRNLTRQGFEHFTPLRRNAADARPRPLFTGYTFVRLDLRDAAWRRINATRGITRLLVTDPRAPRALPDAFIAALKARSDDGGHIVSAPDLRLGDSVEVMEGPFARIVARIEHLDADERLVLLLDLMGRKVRVKLPAHAVERITR